MEHIRKVYSESIEALSSFAEKKNLPIDVYLIFLFSNICIYILPGIRFPQKSRLDKIDFLNIFGLGKKYGRCSKRTNRKTGINCINSTSCCFE